MRALCEKKHQCRPCVGPELQWRSLTSTRRWISHAPRVESLHWSFCLTPHTWRHIVHVKCECHGSLWFKFFTVIKQWFLYFLPTKPLHTLQTVLRTLKNFCLCESYLVIFRVLENKTEKLKNVLNFKTINPLHVLMKNNYIFQNKVRRVHHFIFLMSDLIESSWMLITASVFKLGPHGMLCSF